MNDRELRRQAKLDAEHFLTYDRDYRMGYIDAEKPHPMTRYLSQTYQQSVQEGVKLLFGVDDQMAQRAALTLTTGEYARFADMIRQTLKQGGRVIFSGCGSSGRLSMNVERCWRSAIAKLSACYPKAAPNLAEALERVGYIMTGGDYAVIRAAESFEDSTALGEAQARQWQLTEKDLLVGVTATGETTSILGTALQALRDGANVYMLICSDPAPLLDKMERTQAVYRHPKCRVLTLDCGPMALTGSTRMQSSTYEQFAACVALEGALYDILVACGENVDFQGYGWYGQQFQNMTAQLLQDRATSLLAKATLAEQKVYEEEGLVTLFADNYLLDVLTDTTERAPTFMTPPFCSADMLDQPQSWAFVKNPNCATDEAWERCFLRKPRCIEWDRAVYEELGLTARQIEKIPDISGKALARYIIGKESMPQRETAPCSYALWVDAEPAPATFEKAAAAYAGKGSLTIAEAGVELPATFTDMYEHLCLKLMLNVLSTGTMARMGRIHGNWMVCLAMSNKKLVDRSARIVSDQCGIPYEEALEELYYAKAAMDAQGVNLSPAQEVIRRYSSREYIGNIILPDKILRGAKLICTNGVIANIIPDAVADTENLPYIAPGYIDIHNHGAMGHDYMEATQEAFGIIADYLTRHGVVAAQCTTVSAPIVQLETFLQAYRQYQQSAGDNRCRFVGVHVEGPYIAPAAKGAHLLDTLLTPEKDGYDWILENSDVITEATVAPELPGMEKMIGDLTQKGILVSGGHDASEPADVETAAKAGMRHCTHIYCAMSTLHKTNGQRVHGLCEYAMTQDTMTAEMIADDHHTPPLLAKMIHKAKGADKVCLVSDAIAPAGLPESDALYDLGTGPDCTKVRVEDGVAMVEDRSCYAGSVQALDQMVRNLVNAGIELCDAVTMASLTPAMILGIHDRYGSIAIGKRADFCVLDSCLQVEKTVIAGNPVYERGA